MATPVILIFDIGKTNKKVLLFDEQYNLIDEQQTQLTETNDEDGYPCEDVHALTNWVQQKFSEILSRGDVDIKAINFSAYGASFVHLDKQENILTPLYNYLKPYPATLQQEFYAAYGNEALLSQQTASPVLGSLNSGMQLYRLKHEQPEVFKRINYSLHLPQYLSCIITKTFAADITSVGCHTLLWDFQKNNYHDWVYKEAIDKNLAPICNTNTSVNFIHNNKKIAVGIGLHDSSAALIPYLETFHEPFVLLSTGTWCISLNPFNHAELTKDELQQDCLCYLSYKGKPVKASRLFAGYWHEEQTKRMAAYFNTAVDYYKTIHYNPALLSRHYNQNINLNTLGFAQKALYEFNNYEAAYHALMEEITNAQIASLQLVLKNAPVKKIFVDGGFSKNDIYMNLLAVSFPRIKVYAANVAQASSFGAALVLHKHLTKEGFPLNLIDLKHCLPAIENA